MYIPDSQRPMITAGLILLISLAFAAGRYGGQRPEPPNRDEALAIEAYRQGDTRAALPLFERLAAGGDANAAYYLGEIYQYGDGVARNGGEAVKWLLRSAKAGDPRAARQLGLAYLEGTDRLQDLAAARRWLQQAAGRGDAQALHRLGDMNARGLGAPADPIAAYADYSAAALLGDRNAAALRDGEAARLGVEQQAEGRRMAEGLVTAAPEAAPTQAKAAAAAAPMAAGDPAHGAQGG